MRRSFWLATALLIAAMLPLVSVRAGEAPSYVELPDAPTITVDWSKANVQSVTLHGNRVMTFSNGEKGGRYLLILKQDQSGSRTVTWPSSVRWPGGDRPPILTTTANKKDYLSMFCDGVSYDVLSLSQNH